MNNQQPKQRFRDYPLWSKKFFFEIMCSIYDRKRYSPKQNIDFGDIKIMYGIIYCALNIVNNKRYIGQTIHSLKKRINIHYSKHSSCIYFHHALVKYPKDSWVWYIIDNGYNKNELNLKEQFWINFFNTTDTNCGYNLTLGGEGSYGVIPTDLHRRRARESNLSALHTKKNRIAKKQ